jgi:hypothetical protein
MHDYWYNFFKDFAGPIATAMAAIAAVSVTAYFAWHQKRLAAEKLRLDLFERRWGIFSSIFNFYYAMISWQKNPSSEQIAAKDRFFIAYQESKFLFKKESGIENLLKDLNEKGMKVIGFKENAEEYKSDLDIYSRKFTEITDIQLREFENGLIKLQDAMSDYLSFEYVRPRH